MPTMSTEQLIAKTKEEYRKEIIEEYEAANKQLKSWDVFVYHPIKARKGVKLTIHSTRELKPYYDNGYYDTPAKFPEIVQPEPDIRAEGEKTEVELMTPLVKKAVEDLLSGKKVNGKTGLSLSSFCSLFNIKTSDVGKRNEKKPLYEKIKASYGDRIYATNNRLYFKD
jgi:hypothetical protein